MSENQEWNGRNRRSHEDRRQQPDRREEIRFEPGKKDRRQSRGRRAEDRDMWEDAMKDD
ncbi:hypothetical protein GCM10011352_29140 [Marinobacterium zhoushanense]|uniref:Uncharacterized protein n=1 Tax=Marinobacterium zhoushanense TaxID=1679163 RepID=A0ABQ1KM36_9GAMM|nr:hypothetical protein [Marinobacterium zhoushanense]GGC01181.1 hypothetical protein GCM10011352_29140 [Marinobacterium zhoushanense]